MSYLVWLIPIALFMGAIGLGAFLWSVRDRQYEDLDGAAERVLLASEDDRPLSSGEERRRGDARPPPRDS